MGILNLSNQTIAQTSGTLDQRLDHIRCIVEQSSEGFYFSAAEGGAILYANPAIEKIYRVKLVEFCSNANLRFDVIDAEDRQRVLNKYQDLLRSGVEFTERYRLTQLTGTTCHVIEHSCLIADETGEKRIVATNIHLDETSESKRQRDRAEIQYALARILAESLDIRDVPPGTMDAALPRLLQAICNTIDADFGELWIVDKSSDTLRCQQTWSSSTVDASEFASYTRNSILTIGEDLPGLVWQNGNPIWLPNVSKNYDFTRRDLAAKIGFQSARFIPISLEREVLGVIGCFSRTTYDIDFDMLQMLSSLGSQLGQYVERKRAERELRESEDRFRLAIKSASIIVFNQDRNLECNWMYGAGRNTEPTIEEGGWRSAVIALQSANSLKRLKQSVIETGVGAREEVELDIHGNHRVFDLTIEPLCDPTGSVVGINCAALDITAHKEIQSQLRSSLSLLEATLESTADAILVVDASGKIASFNAQFVEMWKIPQSVVESRDDRQALSFVTDQLIHPEKFLCKVEKLYACPEAESFDTIEFKDGRIIERYSRPQRIGSQVIGRVWSFRDVTKHRHAEDAVAKMADEWRATFDAISEGVMMLSPDFNVIRCNKAMLDFAGEGIIDPEKCRCYAHVHQTVEPIADCPVRKALATGKQATAELELKDRWFHVIADPVIDEQGRVSAVTHVMIDITERKKTDAALRESEERFRLLFERSPLGYQSLDEAGRLLQANQAWLDTLGYSSDEVIGHWFGEFLAPDFVDHFRQNFPRFKAAGEIHGVEFQMVRKDGSLITAAFDGKIGHDQQGRFKQTHCVLRDITAQKAAEAKLRESEEKFSLFMQFLPGLAFIKDDQRRLLYANERYEEYFGRKLEDCIGKSADERWESDVAETFARNDQSVLSELKPLTTEEKVPIDGETHCFLTHKFPIIREGRSPLMGAICIDITDRKKTEEALRLKNLVFDASIAANSTADVNGIITMTNIAFLRMWGYSSKVEVIGKPIRHFFENENEATGIVSALNENGECEGDYVARRKDGSTFAAHGLATLLRNESGEIIGYESSVIDVTDRKLAEKALLISEEKYLKAFRSSPIALTLARAEDGVLVEANQAFEVISGYSVAEALGKTAIELNLFPDPSERAVETLKTKKQMLNVEMHLRHKSGEPRIVQCSAELITIDQTEYILSTTEDVTERKRAEEALQERERRLSTIYDTVGDVIFHLRVEADESFRFISVNQAFCNVTGLDMEMVVGKLVNEVIPEPSLSIVLAKYRQAIEQNSVVRWEETSEYPSGRLTGDVSIAPVVDNEGRCTHLVGSVHNITERKNAEEALRISEERFRQVTESSDEWIWEVNAEGLYTYASHVVEKILGYKPDEIVGKKHFYDFFVPAEKDELKQGALRAFAVKESFLRFVNPNVHKNGKRVVLETSGAPICDSQGKLIGYRGVDADITERMNAEEKIRSLARFPAENPHPVLRVDKNGNVMYANPAAVDLVQSWTAEIGASISVPWLEEIDSALSSGRTHQFETTVHDRSYLLTLAPIPDEGYVSIYALDITDRKKAEEAQRENELKYRTLFESAHDAILMLKGEVFIDCNPEAEKMFGASREQILGTTPYRWSPPTQPDGRRSEEAAAEHIERALNKESHIFQWRHLNMKGEPFDIEVGLTSIEIAGETRVMSIVRDITERRRSEKALRESEERFRRIFEEGPLGMATVDADFRFVRVNEAFCKMVGYSEQELTSLTFNDITHPDHVTESVEVGKRMAEGELPLHRMEKRYIRKDNRVVWGGVTITVIRDNSGKFLYYLTMIEDITESKHAEEDLRESEERYRRLLESVTDYIYSIKIVDGKPVSTSHSEGCFAVTGYTSKEFEESPYLWFEMIVEEDRFAVQRLLNAAISGEAILPVEHRIMHRNGSIRWVRNTPTVHRDEDGAIVSSEGLISDITDLKRAEDELARLATAVEQATEAIIITDTEGNIEYVNPAFERITGYLRDEVIGQNAPLFKSGEQDRAFYQTLWETLKSGRAWVGKFKNKKKDGSLYYEESAISPIRDSTGKIINYVAVKRDISQEIELESRLRQSQKLEAVGLLAAGIAHDFNNLLAGIKGFAELLTLDTKAGLKVSAYAEEILKAANRAADLTGQLLAFARKGNYLAVSVDMHHIIDEAAAILVHSINKRIVVEKHFRATNAVVRGDPSQIQSAILNLSVNARDAMPEGGLLKFVTENVQCSEEYCRIHSLDSGQGEYLAVSVIDSGTGIDKSLISHIFDPFFTTKEQGQGTGLGLAGVYGCLKNHHGTIEVETEPGKGSVFRLIFPIIKAEAEHDQIVKKTEAELTGKEHILIADDEAMVRDLAERMLTKSGYKVTKCADGAEAIESYHKAKDKIDLVLLDIIMPRMNGKDAFAAMKRDNPSVRTILMSGYSDHNVAETLEQGMVGFLPKPFQMKQLLAIVREALDAPAIAARK